MGENQQQTQQHMASTPGFEPGPDWWEASALTTAPPLLPKGTKKHYVVLQTRDQSCDHMAFPAPIPETYKVEFPARN